MSFAMLEAILPNSLASAVFDLPLLGFEDGPASSDCLASSLLPFPVATSVRDFIDSSVLWNSAVLSLAMAVCGELYQR